jgi:hypothetical protein
MSDITSAENKLTSMRVRSGQQPKLAMLIGQPATLISKERSDMRSIADYYKRVCSWHHWYWAYWW